MGRINSIIIGLLILLLASCEDGRTTVMICRGHDGEKRIFSVSRGLAQCYKPGDRFRPADGAWSSDTSIYLIEKIVDREY